ncbi:MAG: lipocalin-like domain-containing protein [Anaerolineae bacterium]|nr:lipocalin-like domain-containing protein [Anaerolineae bacterium]MCO5189192.1 lipocalin-like domain-containing protein [Anaerolineae bacterium]MCO5195804.1 lipocalin-like domain-containing protein [Anaerolineae bacterium]MCO5204386.1 lipocalin-like domain-containing protein [Anaerolineae bacterium]
MLPNAVSDCPHFNILSRRDTTLGSAESVASTTPPLYHIQMTSATVSNVTQVDVVGCWRLQTCTFQAADNTISYPFGAQPDGLLIYAANGWMSVQIMRVNRPNFASGIQLGGTDAEIRVAFEGYNAYFGRYEVDVSAGIITHHAVGNLYPNGIATVRRRFFRLSGDTLTLTTPSMHLGRDAAVGTLIWRRIHNQPH